MGKEVFGEEGYLDAAAEAAAGHARGEVGRGVLFGVTGEFGHFVFVVVVVGGVWRCMNSCLSVWVGCCRFGVSGNEMVYCFCPYLC